MPEKKGTTVQVTNLFGETVEKVIPAKIRELTDNVLRDYPGARSNDMLLLVKVWQAQGFQIPEGLIRDGFNAESVMRWRRKLQEQGRYPAPKVVQDARDQKEEDFRRHMKR